MMESKSLCVVVPCFNEEEVLPQCLEDLVGALKQLSGLEWYIVFVDDGSTDGTLPLLNSFARDNKRIKVFSLSRNYGHQVALTAGLDHVSSDAVVLMDCDLQHPPSLILELVDKWKEGYEVVSALRLETEGVSFIKNVSSRFFYSLINLMSDVRIEPGAADFCLLSRTAQEALCKMPERHRFIRGMISWIGFRRAIVPFTSPARAAGRSKYSFYKMISFAMDAIVSFSGAPLRFFSRLGIFFVVGSLFYLGYILLSYFFLGGTVPGWASMISVVIIIGGIQLMAIGLCGEYLSRIFDEAKRRPLYFFKQKEEAGDCVLNGQKDRT